MIGNKKDLLSGLLVLLLGAATVIGSFNYTIGTLVNMGPGYFGLMSGWLLVFLSVPLLIRGARGYLRYKELARDDDELVDRIQLLYGRSRIWFFVSMAMLSFIFLSFTVGFVVASFSLVFLACFADRTNTVKEAFFLASGLTVFVVVIFYYLLQIQIPLLAL